MPNLGDILNSVLQDARNTRDVLLSAFSDPSRTRSGEHGTASFEEVLAKAASQGESFANGSQTPNQATGLLGQGSAPVLNLLDPVRPLDGTHEGFLGTEAPSFLSLRTGSELSPSNEVLSKVLPVLDSLKGAISGLLQRLSEILEMAPSEAQQAIRSLPGFSAQTGQNSDSLEALGSLTRDLPEGENPLLLPRDQQDQMVGQWLQQMVAGQQIQLGILGAKSGASMVPGPDLQGSETSISGVALRFTFQETDVKVAHREGPRVMELFLHLENLQMTASFQGPFVGKGSSDPKVLDFKPFSAGTLNEVLSGSAFEKNLNLSSPGEGLQKNLKDLVGLLLFSGVTRAALNSYVVQPGTGQTQPLAGEIFPNISFPRLPTKFDHAISRPDDAALKTNLGGASPLTQTQAPWNLVDTQNQVSPLNMNGPEAPRSSVISFPGSVGPAVHSEQTSGLGSGTGSDQFKSSLGPSNISNQVPVPGVRSAPGGPQIAAPVRTDGQVPSDPNQLLGVDEGKRSPGLSNLSVLNDLGSPRSGVVNSFLAGFQESSAIFGLNERTDRSSPASSPSFAAAIGNYETRDRQGGNQVIGNGIPVLGPTLPATIPGPSVQTNVFSQGNNVPQGVLNGQQAPSQGSSLLPGPVMTAGAQGANLIQPPSTSSAPINSWNHASLADPFLTPVAPVTLQAVKPVQDGDTSPSLNLAFEGKKGDFPGLPVPGQGTIGNLAAGLTQPAGSNISVAVGQDIPPSIDPRQDAASILGRITDQVGNRASELRALSHLSFQLIPESLGRVTVQLALVDHSVTAKIIVSRPEVREALQNNMVELRTALNQAGLQIDQLQVQVQGGGANLLAQYFQYQQEGSGYRLPVDPAALAKGNEETIENNGNSSPVSTRNLLVDVLA